MAKDEADLAADEEEYFRNESLYQARQDLRLKPIGHCYNCGEFTEVLFCDTECRRDYEREQQVRKRQRGGM